MPWPRPYPLDPSSSPATEDRIARVEASVEFPVRTEQPWRCDAWPPVGVASLRFPQLAVRVKSYRFGLPTFSQTAAASNVRAAQPTVRAAQPAQAAAHNNLPSSATRGAAGDAARFRPPKDLVKLDDRLFYILQPPLESLIAAGAIEFPHPPFPYQLAGIGFLFPRHAAILADEMGLGKTMQAISTIRMLLHAREISRVLLICPKPLVSNWQREFQLWAPEIPLCVIEGSPATRAWQWQTADFPVKIANYEVVTRDQPVLADAAPHYDLVVLDEAQRIKNHRSATAQVVCSLDRARSWALTGTPVENSTDDIVGIFEFVAKGLLTLGMSPRAIAGQVREYILRRTKDAVMTQMPPKLMRDAEIELTPEQAETYARAEDEGVLRLNRLGQSISIQHVFELVLRLKQICNFDPATGASSKMERLTADLDEVAASGQKAIVFSQWVDTLRRIGQTIPRHRPLEYHGGIPSRQRDAILHAFRHDPTRRVLLMSYGAGSVGLNLQFCRYVFLFDRWWNPAVEDQAINRAHRIGVSGSVTVTRMLSLNTIEERINQVLEEKRELFQDILGDVAQTHSGLTKDEIFRLFKLRSPRVA